MKTLYNPKENECPEYTFNGSKVNIDGLGFKKMKQYQDDVAEDMKHRWEFLMDVSPADVEKILEKNKKESEQIKEVKVDEVPVIDPSIVPVDSPKEVKVDEVKQQSITNAPEFYGPGLTETSSKVPSLGKGHF